MKNNLALRAVWSLCALLSACILHSHDVSAQEIANPPRIKSPYTACFATDKVAVTALNVTPREPIPGQGATITMKIKNLCPAETDPLKNIYWEITKGEGGNVLHTGTIDSLAGGDTSTITRTMTGECGQHRFDGWVDQSNRLREAESARENNDKELTVHAVNRTVTRALNPRKVKAFAFTVSQSNNLPPGCSQHNSGWDASGSSDRVTFKIRCIGALGFQDRFSAFRIHQFDHGWRVKAVDIVDQRTTGKAAWAWETQPASGSDSPWLVMKLTSDAFSSVEVSFRVSIEGPECHEPIPEPYRR